MSSIRLRRRQGGRDEKGTMARRVRRPAHGRSAPGDGDHSHGHVPGTRQQARRSARRRHPADAHHSERDLQGAEQRRGHVHQRERASRRLGAALLRSEGRRSARPGHLHDIARAPFRAWGQAGMDVISPAGGCNTVSGEFTVLEATYGPYLPGIGYLRVISFEATFEMYCSGASGAFAGHVRYEDPPDLTPPTISLLTDLTTEAEDATGTNVYYSYPYASDSDRPQPDAVVRSAVRCTVPDRRDDRHLYRDRLLGQRGAGDVRGDRPSTARVHGGHRSPWGRQHEDGRRDHRRHDYLLETQLVRIRELRRSRPAIRKSGRRHGTVQCLRAVSVLTDSNALDSYRHAAERQVRRREGGGHDLRRSVLHALLLLLAAQGGHAPRDLTPVEPARPTSTASAVLVVHAHRESTSRSAIPGVGAAGLEHLLSGLGNPPSQWLSASTSTSSWKRWTATSLRSSSSAHSVASPAGEPSSTRSATQRLPVAQNDRSARTSACTESPSRLR